MKPFRDKRLQSPFVRFSCDSARRSCAAYMYTLVYSDLAAPLPRVELPLQTGGHDGHVDQRRWTLNVNSISRISHISWKFWKIWRPQCWRFDRRIR